MNKKLKELSDKELFDIIYVSEDERRKLVSYKDRPSYPDNPNIPAIDIGWDCCRFCKLQNERCDCKCKFEDIDFEAIKHSIYAEDEVRLNEDTKEIN